MSDLASALKTALADTFMFYVEAHIFHWNVTGPTFSELHELFGEIYEDAHTAVDAIAEHLRTLDEKAPHSLAELVAGSKVTAESTASDAKQMVAQLLDDNDAVSACLAEAQQAAEDAGKVGIANFLQDRIDRHAKWHWMFGATLETSQRDPLLRRMAIYDHPRSQARQ